MFKTVQGKHQKIADNYLSLKAYAAAAEQQINAYVAKGKGKNLNSLGDLLTNVAGMSKVTPTKQEGLSPSDHIPSIFTGMANGGVKIDNKVAEKAGNWVYINGHAVGLSNKLNDFESLAVRM